jgi:transcriptional regulator with XRE-family HTH domain
MGKPKRKSGETVPFGTWYLRKWRKANGLTLDQLADMVGSTGATISRMERGKQPYTQPMLEALAKALKCEPWDLIERPPSAADKIRAVLEDMSPEDQRRAIAVVQALKVGDKGG